MLARIARAVLCSTAVFAGCARPSVVLSDVDVAGIQRAALTTLFIDREHSRLLVLIDVARDSAPVLSDAAANPERLNLRLPDTTALAFPIPVRVVTLRDVEAVFRDFPDGWKAWYTRYPVSAGIVELTSPVVARADDDIVTAELTVARACGEHCRAVWRVSLRREGNGSWHTASVTPVGLPKN